MKKSVRHFIFLAIFLSHSYFLGAMDTSEHGIAQTHDIFSELTSLEEINDAQTLDLDVTAPTYRFDEPVLETAEISNIQQDAQANQQSFMCTKDALMHYLQARRGIAKKNKTRMVDYYQCNLNVPFSTEGDLRNHLNTMHVKRGFGGLKIHDVLNRKPINTNERFTQRMNKHSTRKDRQLYACNKELFIIYLNRTRLKLSDNQKESFIKEFSQCQHSDTMTIPSLERHFRKIHLHIGPGYVTV